MEQNNSRRFLFRAPKLHFTRKHLWFGAIAFIVFLFGFAPVYVNVPTPSGASPIVTGTTSNLQYEMQVLRASHPKAVMIYICTGYACDEQKAAIEEVARLFAERLKIIQMAPTTIPDVTDIVAQKVGARAYPMFYVMTPDGESSGAASVMTVRQLSAFINSAIGGPADTGGNGPATQATQLPELSRVVVLSEANPSELRARAQAADAVYTLWCGAHDPVCLAQLQVIDTAAAGYTNVLFVYADSESEANLDLLVQSTAALGRLATPTNIITNRGGATTSWVGFIPAQQIGSFIEAGLAATAQPPVTTPGTVPTTTPGATQPR